MALEQIFVKIFEDAKLEAENIVHTGLEEADKILASAVKEAALLKDKIIAASRSEGEFTFRKEVVSQRLRGQRELLKTKKIQLDNCFQDALDMLLNLDDNLYRNLIKNMLTKIDFKEEAEILFSTHDRTRISQDYIHKLNRHLKLSFSNDIKGGFILQTKELIMDNSLDNVLTSLRQDLEPKIAQILFKQS